MAQAGGELHAHRSWRSRIPSPLRHGVTIFVILLVVEYLVIPKFVAASHAVTLLSHVNVPLVILAVGFEGAALFTYALLTRVLLPPQSPGVGTLFRVDLATTAIAHIVPGGSAASATLGYRLFTRLGVDGKAVGFAMATQGLGSAVVLNVLLWLSLVISIPFAGIHPIYATVAVVGMLAILAVAALVFSFTRGEAGAINVVRSIGRRVPRLTEDQAEAVVRHIGDSLRELWSNRGQLRMAIVWATANWLLDATCLWCFLAAFHRYVNPVELLAAYGIGNVLAVLPLTPGGLGVVETTTILLLSSFGVPKGIALEAVIGWRLINFWLPIPVGAGCYISLRAQIGTGQGGRRAALAEMASSARQPLAGDPAPEDAAGTDRDGPAPSPAERPAIADDITVVLPDPAGPADAADPADPGRAGPVDLGAPGGDDITVVIARPAPHLEPDVAASRDPDATQPLPRRARSGRGPRARPGSGEPPGP